MAFIAVGIGAGVSAIGGIASSAIQAGAASDAADAQSQAAREANALQWKMYQQNRDDNEPWRNAGKDALGRMQADEFQKDFTMQDFQQDPGYAFRMSEGQKAIERSAAARGGLGSGATMKALARYGQDFASNEYQNAYNRFNADRDRRYNRLSSVAGAGQNAVNSTANAGMNYANQAGGNLIGAGNAQAAASLATGQSYANTVSGIGQAGLNAYQQQNWMNQWKANQG